MFFVFCVFFFIFVFLSAEIALAFALRAGDETRQGDLTNVATAPRGECLPRQEAGGGGLGDFFRKKRKRSGAFSSPLKKLCLFIRRKELRILAGRLGTSAEEELESCHGCWARVPGPRGPGRGGAPRPASARASRPWCWFPGLASLATRSGQGCAAAGRPNLNPGVALAPEGTHASQSRKGLSPLS